VILPLCYPFFFFVFLHVLPRREPCCCRFPWVILFSLNGVFFFCLVPNWRLVDTSLPSASKTFDHIKLLGIVFFQTAPREPGACLFFAVGRPFRHPPLPMGVIFFLVLVDGSPLINFFIFPLCFFAVIKLVLVSCCCGAKVLVGFFAPSFSFWSMWFRRSAFSFLQRHHGICC